MTLNHDDNHTPKPISEELVDALGSARSVVMMTHRGPDADGVGSELALAYALEGAGKKVHIVNADRLPPRIRFLDPDGRCHAYRRPLTAVVRGADLGLLVDTSEVVRAGNPAALRKRTGGPFLCMDHHPACEKSLNGFIDAGSASTAEMTLRLLRRMELPLTPQIASALYAGILFDTASFRFIRGNPAPLRAAAELVEAGADVERIQRELLSQPRDYIVLLGRLLGETEFHADDRVAVCAVTNEHLSGLELDPDDIREVVNLLNSTRGVVACAFIRQRGPKDWRINLRCVEGYAIDGIARDLDGGGHPRASGASLRGVDAAGARAELARRLVAVVEGPAPEEAPVVEVADEPSAEAAEAV